MLCISRGTQFFSSLIGMLAADGIYILRNIHAINRGYTDLAGRLNSLGARITVLHEI